MIDATAFSVFVEKIRAGDAEAARELVRRYEAVIRREVRLRMDNARLNRLLDSLDISQSVLSSFFARVSEGRFEFESPEQLARLLISMARNKLAFQARMQRAKRRDNRLTVDGRVEDLEVVSKGPGPSDSASVQDLYEEVRKRLSPEERRIADLWSEGWGWPEIVERLGGTLSARRMQLSRAIHRVSRQMNQEDRTDA
jgi:RNA polymerase sigma-70 factor (ECF subfamily)